MAGPRWFGLGDAEAVRSSWEAGERLRGWVARSDDIDAVLARHGDLLGGRISVSRGGKHSQFSLPPDGALPLGGALPSVIDRNGRGSPAARMPDLGARLRGFVLEHPAPAETAALYEEFGVRNAPRLREGPSLRYSATIETAQGGRTLS